MRIDLEFLKTFVNLDLARDEIKELLASLGIEVDEIIPGDVSTVFGVEITPNRPDWLSHLGIAREIHAKLPQLPLTIPEYGDTHNAVGEGGEAVEIEIESSTDCRRYTGCVVNNIHPDPSPARTIRLLEALGLRSKNQVVDASNQVIMAIGHPIHMFDLDKLEGGKIVVRRAKPGETLRLLDDREVELSRDDLVIADARKPVALAGIMGGAETGVTESTRSVFIESAWFDPVRVRLTARRLGLQTDASYRFERGADVSSTPLALSMALDLMGEWCGKQLNPTGYRDMYPGKRRNTIVEMPADFPSRYTGIDIPRDEAASILERLGFRIGDHSSDIWIVTVPTFRVDIACKQDLVEEIIRIFGYNRILPRIASTVNPVYRPASRRDIRLKAVRNLIANGFHQALHYSFHALEDNRVMDERKDMGVEGYIALRNPLGRDFAIMRNSLIPGLLRSTALNANHGAAAVRLFETGKRFRKSKSAEPLEEEMLSVTAWGEQEPFSWRNSKAVAVDFYYFRAEMEALLKSLGADFILQTKKIPWLKDDCSFSIEINGNSIGWMGCLCEDLTRNAGINGCVPAMEIVLESLLACRGIEKFKLWNRMPMVKRDLSVLVPGDVCYRDLEKAISIHRPGELESYRLFDYYSDTSGATADHSSMALSFYYRHPERTLTGEEVNQIHEKLVETLVSVLKLEPRS